MIKKGPIKKLGREKLKKYVNADVISSSHLLKIMDAETYDDIITALGCFLEIDEEKSKRIWEYVINNVWIGVKTDSEKSTCFDENECIFFRELLRNKGMLTRDHCIKKIFKTSHISDRVTGNLEDLKIIDRIPLRNREIVYLLNLEFHHEVFNRGK